MKYFLSGKIAQVIFLFFLISLPHAFGGPAEVLLIRHAEKSNKSGNELSSRGYERAKALHKLFKHRPELLTFGRPIALFALSPQKDGGSLRSFQTLQPLSEDLGLAIHSEFEGNDVLEIVRKINSDDSLNGKMVVICWHRSGLEDLASAFGVKSVPKWGKDTFDRIWRIDFSSSRGAPEFSDFPQKLLEGDSDQ